jgi:hypothetical protein
VAFSPIGRNQGTQERQNVDAVSLDATGAAIDLDAGGIEDTALDADLRQCPGQPEAVIPGLVTDQDPTVVPGSETQPADQFHNVAAADAMNARSITVGMCDASIHVFLLSSIAAYTVSRASAGASVLLMIAAPQMLMKTAIVGGLDQPPS